MQIKQVLKQLGLSERHAAIYLACLELGSASVQMVSNKAGFARLRVDGKIYDVNEKISMDKYKVHHIEVVVDRLRIKPDIKKRLTESIETALRTGEGIVIVDFQNSTPEKIFS